jgi:hypothetical protein
MDAPNGTNSAPDHRRPSSWRQRANLPQDDRTIDLRVTVVCVQAVVIDSCKGSAIVGGADAVLRLAMLRMRLRARLITI